MVEVDRNRNLRTLELTSREVELLLKYGYPFPEQEQALRESKAVKGYHRVAIDKYWIDMMLVDLSRSAREIRSARVLDELEALCWTMECALAERGKTRLR